MTITFPDHPRDLPDNECHAPAGYCAGFLTGSGEWLTVLGSANEYVPLFANEDRAAAWAEHKGWTRVRDWRGHSIRWVERVGSYFKVADPQPTRAGVTLTRDQLEAWAGRALSDEDVAWLDEAIPNSSIPEAVGVIVGSFAPDCELGREVPPPAGVTEAIDRDGDEWQRLDDGHWWLPPAGEARTWAEVWDRFGPLELAEWDQS